MNTQKITQLRKLSGYTQQEMADRMNRSLSSYNRLERGETAMTLDDIEKIAAVFHMPVQEILNGEHLNMATHNGQYTVAEKDQIQKLFEEIQEIKMLLQRITPAA